MKKLSISIKVSLCMAITAIMILSLTACSLTKTAVTSDAFKTAAEELGLTVEDMTDFYSGNASLTSCMAAASMSGDKPEWIAAFMVFDTSSSAIQSFQTNMDTMDDVSGGVEVSMNGKNYKSFSKTTGEKYMYVCCVDNTLIYVDTEAELKDTAQSLLQAIDY